MPGPIGTETKQVLCFCWDIWDCARAVKTCGARTCFCQLQDLLKLYVYTVYRCLHCYFKGTLWRYFTLSHFVASKNPHGFAALNLTTSRLCRHKSVWTDAKTTSLDNSKNLQQHFGTKMLINYSFCSHVRLFLRYRCRTFHTRSIFGVGRPHGQQEKKWWKTWGKTRKIGKIIPANK